MIPPMTDPLGRYWEQPDMSRVLIDDTHALMDAATFAGLCEYSASCPTGVYNGKAWKRHDGVFARDAFGRALYKPEECPWMLCWYGPCDDPNKCAIEHRRILVAWDDCAPTETDSMLRKLKSS